jgi:hypothetical protein
MGRIPRVTRDVGTRRVVPRAWPWYAGKAGAIATRGNMARHAGFLPHPLVRPQPPTARERPGSRTGLRPPARSRVPGSGSPCLLRRPTRPPYGPCVKSAKSRHRRSSHISPQCPARASRRARRPTTRARCPDAPGPHGDLRHLRSDLVLERHRKLAAPGIGGSRLDDVPLAQQDNPPPLPGRRLDQLRWCAWLLQHHPTPLGTSARKAISSVALTAAARHSADPVATRL